MENVEKNRWLVVLVTLSFTLIIVLIALVLGILVWAGLGLILLGLVLLIIASTKNNDIIGIWGTVFVMGGLMAVLEGISYLKL